MPSFMQAIRDAGARGDGSDDSTPIQNALDEIERAGGGTLLFEEPKDKYGVEKTLFIPKVNISIIGRGLHTAIVWKNKDSSDPVFTWKDGPKHVEAGFLLRDLTIRRENSGNVIQYSPSDTRHRWCGKIQNVKLKQPNNGSGTLLFLQGALNCHLEDILLEGGSEGGVGLHLKDGSNALIIGVTVMLKGQAPNGILIAGGGQHHIIKARTEGSGGSYSYKFIGVKNSLFESLKSEGENELTVIHVENCEDLIFLAPSAAAPETGKNPNGMVFENSRRCTVSRAICGSMKRVGSGFAFVFDEKCSDIVVDGYIKTDNALEEVDDRGGDGIVYTIQDAAGRRISSLGVRKTRRI